VWITRAVLLLLVIGFPIALIFAWMHQLVPADGLSPRATTLGYVLIGALVSYEQLAPAPSSSHASERCRGRTGRAHRVAIAVPPFVNLSDDRAQEFFSDGMTEEITWALAKVQGLTVLARTSAF
jgi:hypothetical protein